MKTKAEVDAELDRLERIIPELIAQHAPDEVLEAFAGEAESLTELPPVGHEAYIRDRISCILASAGLIPGDSEGEDCLPD